MFVDVKSISDPGFKHRMSIETFKYDLMHDGRRLEILLNF